MTTKERILLESKVWREEKFSLDENYFKRIDDLRKPRILWISSTDNLVSAQELTNVEPGELIHYSNLGIQIRPDDQSFMAVLEDAVVREGVRHIMVCAYSHCSGVSDIIQGVSLPPRNREWLKELQALYEQNLSELRGLSTPEREKLLNEINIRQQVINLSRLDVIQQAWEHNDYPKIIGWYFDLTDGNLKEVFSLEKNHRLKQTASLLDSAQR